MLDKRGYIEGEQIDEAAGSAEDVVKPGQGDFGAGGTISEAREARWGWGPWRVTGEDGAGLWELKQGPGAGSRGWKVVRTASREEDAEVSAETDNVFGGGVRGPDSRSVIDSVEPNDGGGAPIFPPRERIRLGEVGQPARWREREACRPWHLRGREQVRDDEELMKLSQLRTRDGRVTHSEAGLWACSGRALGGSVRGAVGMGFSSA